MIPIVTDAKRVTYFGLILNKYKIFIYMNKKMILTILEEL